MEGRNIIACIKGMNKQIVFYYILLNIEATLNPFHFRYQLSYTFELCIVSDISISILTFLIRFINTYIK